MTPNTLKKMLATYEKKIDELLEQLEHDKDNQELKKEIGEYMEMYVNVSKGLELLLGTGIVGID